MLQPYDPQKEIQFKGETLPFPGKFILGIVYKIQFAFS